LFELLMVVSTSVPHSNNAVVFIGASADHRWTAEPLDFGLFEFGLLMRRDGDIPRQGILGEAVSGMLYWTYDSFEQPRLYHAASDWALFVRKMGKFE
jgi:hypothetical protein